jgi:Lon protease-like protein
MNVPLFPLRTVLFPDGPLPLRIFEARYLDMISECLKSANLFGVLLIRNGSETGTASTYEVGTLARIVDWYQGSDGLLGITAIGDRRFRLISSWRRDDGLNFGEVELLPDVDRIALPEACLPLAQILASVLDDLGRLYENLERHYDDAGWVANRFAEILSIPAGQKQRCLELDDPLARLESVRAALASAQAPGMSSLD